MIQQLSRMLSMRYAACQYISDREGMFCTRRQIAPYLSEECLSAAQFMPRLRRSERGGMTERERKRWRENTDDWLLGEKEAELCRWMLSPVEPLWQMRLLHGGELGKPAQGAFGDSNLQYKRHKESGFKDQGRGTCCLSRAETGAKWGRSGGMEVRLRGALSDVLLFHI